MHKLLSLSLLCLGVIGGVQAQTCTTTITTFPYTENFDGASAPGWTSGGTNSSWALGTPAKPIINSAASGTKAWVTSLTGQYNNDEKSYVQGPCFNLSTLIQPVVEMKVWWNSEFSIDGAVLQSSIDGGTTWVNVGVKGDPNNWFNDNSLGGAPGGQPGSTAEGWTGRNSSGNGSNGWVTVKHILTGLGGNSNVKLRIAFGTDGTTQDDGFAFDNFTVYETAANDAGVTSITSPLSPVTPGSTQPVTVTVKNYGISPLTAATLGFSVNGVVQPTSPWTGNLALNANAAPVTIGNYTFPAGVYTLKAWSKSPNGTADATPTNDTTKVTIFSCASLSGNYTINKGAVASSTNFTSISTAAQALGNCGVNGPVTFSIVAGSGPYNEQVVLPVIPGATSVNTVTFEGNGNTISAVTASANPAVISFTGADFVKVNNLKIAVDPTATAGWGVQLMNASDNDIISNCTITVPLTSTASTVNGIIVGAATSTIGNNANNLLIQNNTINGGYYGIQLNGTTTGTTTSGNRIIGNQIRDPYTYGIYLNTGGTGTIIEGNDISRPTRTTVSTLYAVYLNGTNTSTSVSKNRIHNTHDAATTLTGSVYGIYTFSAAAVGSENIISNNVIYNINNPGGTLNAFYNSGGNNTYYYHNTVSVDNPAITYGTLKGIYFQSASTNVKFINNIISLSSPSTSKHAIYLNSSTIALASNNNDLNVGSTGNIGYYSTNKATLADWKAANSNAYDQNSVSADPLFANPATGNLQPSSGALNNIAQPLAAVTTDITGATRSTTTPDPGAYEFGQAANDAGISAIISPNSGCGLTNQETVTITVTNFGIATLSNIPVSYTINGGTPVTETIAGPLASGATVTYSFTTKADLSAIATYTIVATVNIVGDDLTANDSNTKSVTAAPSVSTLPYTEGFENGNGGWTAGGTASSWELGTPAKTVINSAAAGTKAWVTSLTGQYNSNENSYVVGPCFNFSGKTDPDFEMKAWWNSEFSWDGAVLQSSIDGGTTWQNVGAFGDMNNWYNDNSIGGAPGGQPTATAEGWTGRVSSNNGSNGWVKVKHRLTGLGGKSFVLLRIAFGSDASFMDDGFAFDDIRIADNTNNLAVNSIVPINKLCGFSASEPITAVIENLGSVPATGFTVSYTVNGGTPVTETYSTPLAGAATANYTFNQTANLAAAGNYTIVVTVTIAGDPETANNSATYTVGNATFTGLPPVFNFEPAGAGIAQLRTVTKAKSAIVEDVDASFGTGSTKGMIMDGVDNTSWTTPVGVTDPWISNPDNFSAAYICFNPSGPATDALLLSFDLKQLYKIANANTNFRVTVNGTQVGPTYRPPFSGTPINWQHIVIDLSQYQNLTGLQIGLESNVKEAYAAGAGTANLIDNIEIKRVSAVTGLKNDALQNQITVFPNPSKGLFNVNLPQGKTYQLVVTDLTGKVILRQQTNGNAQLKLEGTAKGIYLLKVSGDNGSAVRKLIVE